MKRGVVGELLDHLLSELHQLERRCAQLEVMLHDLAIRHAEAGEEAERQGDDGEERPDSCGAGHLAEALPPPCLEPACSDASR
jgi:hypothetical protein